jgi:hypothetical protein
VFLVAQHVSQKLINSREEISDAYICLYSLSLWPIYSHFVFQILNFVRFKYLVICICMLCSYRPTRIFLLVTSKV